MQKTILFIVFIASFTIVTNLFASNPNRINGKKLYYELDLIYSLKKVIPKKIISVQKEEDSVSLKSSSIKKDEPAKKEKVIYQRSISRN